MSTLYTVVLPLPEEYHDAIQDMLRLVIIQMTMFIMYSMSCSSGATLASYLIMQMFMLLGAAMYWLVFRKVVTIRMSP